MASDLKQTSRIVDAVLRARLGRAGFDKVVVREERDEEGRPVLKIRSIFKPGSAKLSGADSIHAIHEVRRALLKQGDERFPYVFHELPEDRAA